MNHLFEATTQSTRAPWRLRDYAAIGFLGGFALMMVEAIERTVVLAPFFTTPGQRLVFLAYFAPTALGSALIGCFIGLGVVTLKALRRWEGQSLTAMPSSDWRRWASAGIKLVLFVAAAGAIALALRPTFVAAGRRLSAFAKEPVRQWSPDVFELARTAFQWAQTHPLIILSVLLVGVGLVVRWTGRRSIVKRVSLSEKQGLFLMPLALLLMGGAYAQDLTYYFSIYDRAVHLPLFVIELALGMVAGALMYRALRRQLWLGRFILAGMVLALGLSSFSLLRFDHDQSLKALFWSRSVAARRTVSFLQWAIDVDRDGFASILGGGDCDDRNPQIHPLAQEIPDNGIDENCLGGDLKSPISDLRPQTSDHATGNTQHGPQNILLITIDALRADHLGCYGYQRATSPHLDRFAQQGQLFLNPYAQGTNTGHSFASMLRSAYGESIFDEGRPTFVEILARHGFSTAFFNARRNWLRGKTWERYRLTLTRGIQFEAHKEERGQWFADDITDKLIEYWKTFSSDQSHFIWAHYLEPHYPYEPHSQFDFGESPADRYDSEIAYTDRALGRLFAALEQSKTWPNTLVIISADHGEAFYEHGQREHSSRPYQEQVRVPLLIRHPAHAPGRFDRAVGLIDLGPTILQFAGIDPPVEYEGVNLFSPTISTDRPVFSETPRNLPEPAFYAWAMIDGSWKLMYDVVGHTVELYNLKDDPGERKNLVDLRVEETHEMRQKFGRWFDLQSLRPRHSGDWQVRRILRK
jgi:arylsulfatase A-like enzyme